MVRVRNCRSRWHQSIRWIKAWAASGTGSSDLASGSRLDSLPGSRCLLTLRTADLNRRTSAVEARQLALVFSCSEAPALRSVLPRGPTSGSNDIRAEHLSAVALA